MKAKGCIHLLLVGYRFSIAQAKVFLYNVHVIPRASSILIKPKSFMHMLLLIFKSFLDRAGCFRPELEF